jgi:hypothetical protein
MADCEKQQTPPVPLAASALLVLIGFFFPLGGLMGLAAGFLALIGLRSAGDRNKLRLTAWILLVLSAIILVTGTLQALTGLAQIQ